MLIVCLVQTESMHLSEIRDSLILSITAQLVWSVLVVFLCLRSSEIGSQVAFYYFHLNSVLLSSYCNIYHTIIVAG